MRARAVIASGAAHVALIVLAVRAAHDRAPPKVAPAAAVTVEVMEPPASAPAPVEPARASPTLIGVAPSREALAVRPARALRPAPGSAPELPAGDLGGERGEGTGEGAGGVGEGAGTVGEGAGGEGAGGEGAGGEGAGGEGAGWATAAQPARPELAQLEVPRPPPPPPPPSRARPPVLIFPARQVQDSGDEPWLARLKIDEDGFVVGSELLRGPPGAVADAVWRFRYRPALDDGGRPVAAVIEQPFLTD